jgi:DNA-binding transcriptional MerR regulator
VFTIGEFSRISGLTVKTLRFYHEQGLLAPAHVDPQTGYRYYAQGQLEAARVIAALRELEFPLAQIAEVLAAQEDETDLLAHLQRQLQAVQDQRQRYGDIARSLAGIIEDLKQERQTMQHAALDVHEKLLEPLLVAGIRMQGRYDECGKAFARIARRFGRRLCGKPLLLHYDTEYREPADYEACIPVRGGKDGDGIVVRELPGGPCFALLHLGPYPDLGRSYARIIEHLKRAGRMPLVPTREVYLKGPGMLFRGNPKKYLTEIQMLVE